MPRQITIDKVVTDLLRGGAVAVPTTRRRQIPGGTPELVPEAGPQDRIGRTVQMLTEARMIQEPDKNTGLAGYSRTFLFSIGAGVVTNVKKDSVIRDEDLSIKKKLKTDFSLLEIESDQTIIPNANIIDFKSLNLKSGTTNMISSTLLFGNKELDTFNFVEPQDQMQELKLEMTKLKSETNSNLIDLASEMILFEDSLKSDQRIETFKISRHKMQTFNKDNASLEFKNFEDPNIIYKDDDDYNYAGGNGRQQ